MAKKPSILIIFNKSLFSFSSHIDTICCAGAYGSADQSATSVKHSHTYQYESYTHKPFFTHYSPLNEHVTYGRLPKASRNISHCANLYRYLQADFCEICEVV